MANIYVKPSQVKINLLCLQEILDLLDDDKLDAAKQILCDYEVKFED